MATTKRTPLLRRSVRCAAAPKPIFLGHHESPSANNPATATYAASDAACQQTLHLRSCKIAKQRAILRRQVRCQTTWIALPRPSVLVAADACGLDRPTCFSQTRHDLIWVQNCMNAALHSTSARNANFQCETWSFNVQVEPQMKRVVRVNASVKVDVFFLYL